MVDIAVRVIEPPLAEPVERGIKAAGSRRHGVTSFSVRCTQ
jgi:hypothetical protein